MWQLYCQCDEKGSGPIIKARTWYASNPTNASGKHPHSQVAPGPKPVNLLLYNLCSGCSITSTVHMEIKILLFVKVDPSMILSHLLYKLLVPQDSVLAYLVLTLDTQTHTYCTYLRVCLLWPKQWNKFSSTIINVSYISHWNRTHLLLLYFVVT